MTDKEKRLIEDYRNSGLSYSQISKAMNLPINSVKTYCRRHRLGTTFYNNNDVQSFCEQCGSKMTQVVGRKKKRFCSDKCRILWWNSHNGDVKKKANYNCICTHCAKEFISYGNKGRKYCSHECYIADRFGGC